MKKTKLRAFLAGITCMAMLASCSMPSAAPSSSATSDATAAPSSAPSAESSTAPAGDKPYAGQKLTLSIFAIMTDKYDELVFNQFEEKTGCEIVVETGSASERYAKVQNNPNSGIDIIVLSQQSSDQGYQQGIFEEIDYTRIPNSKDLVSGAKKFVERRQAPPYELNQFGIIYNPEVVKAEDIKEYTDIFKPQFADSVAIPTITSTYGPVMVDIAAKHAGVDFSTDSGEAAFKSLELLKPNLVQIYSSSSEIKNMFATGEISVALAGNFAYDMLGADTKMVWYVPESGGYMDFNTMNILKTSANKELAYEFINYMIELETQTRFCDGLPSSGVNVNLDPAIAERHPNTTSIAVAEKSNALDYAVVYPLFSDWVDRWNRTMAN